MLFSGIMDAIVKTVTNAIGGTIGQFIIGCLVNIFGGIFSFGSNAIAAIQA